MAEAIVCGAGAAGLAGAAALRAVGVLDEDGKPLVSGASQHPSAPGLFFNDYRSNLSGQLRLMRPDARAIARAVRRSRGFKC